MSPRLIKYIRGKGVDPTAPPSIHVERGLLPHAYPSECVASLNYDGDTEELTVEFHERGTYKYFNFPFTEWILFNDAMSRGTYFNLYVRDRYSFERIG